MPLFLRAYTMMIPINIILVACAEGQVRQSGLSDATVGAGAIKRSVALGDGYSEKNGIFLSNSCVTGEIETKNLSLSGGDVSFIVDASYTDIVNSLSGSLDASMNLASIKASAGAQLAKKAAKTSLSTNIYAYINMIGQASSFTSGSRKLGQDALIPGIHKETYCGTDFVNQIDYGASIGVSLEVSAKTELQKQKIAGYLKVNVLNFVEGSGNIESIDDSERQDYSVRLMIKQVGGKPQNITLAIPADGMFCGIGDIKQCIGKMNAVIQYMQTQMRSDLEDKQYWNPINYHTMSYKNAASVRSLAAVDLTQDQRRMLARAHENIKAYYERTMEDWKDVDTIAAMPLNQNERNLIQKITESVTHNAVALERAISECQIDYYYCMDIASDSSRLNLKSYDPDFRQIGFVRNAQNYCSLLIAKSITSGLLSPEQGRNLTLEGSAPVFENQKDVTSQMVGFAPCTETYKSLSE